MNLIPESSRQWWRQRDPREQKILFILFLFLIGVVGYTGIFKPIVGSHWEVQQQYDEANNTYRWLQDQITVLNKIKADSGGILPSIVSVQQLKEEIEDEFAKLKIAAQINVISRGNLEFVEVAVSGANSIKLMRWLEKMVRMGRYIQAMDLNNKSGKLSGIVLIEGKG